MKENGALILLLVGAGLVFFSMRANSQRQITGVYPVSSSVGQRNNNPLNIRYNAANNWDGQIASKSGPFAYFTDKKYGYRAAFKLIDNYVNKHNLKLISDIIYRWAPPEDNNPTEAYIQYVINKSGIPSFKYLTRADYKKVIQAMAFFESKDSDTQALNDGFILAFGG